MKIRDPRPYGGAQRVRFFIVSAITALTLAACSTQPPVASVPATSSNGAVAPASQPGTGSGYSNYGHQLTVQAYIRLVSGNTLFRPLADGGRTRIYIGPGETLSMIVTNPAGQTVRTTGSQTISENTICWHIKGQTAPLCFAPYWNGRLMTFYFVGNTVQPAQFLIEKGKYHS